jgi:hypothetical protein
VIDVLDPAGYGAVTITKAISIQGHGFAGVSLAAHQDGFTANAGPNDAVNIDGVLIEGVATDNGILFHTGRSLVVKNTAVHGTSAGLWMQTNVSTSQTLAVSRSQFADGGGAAIEINPQGSGAVTASIDHVTIANWGVEGVFVTNSGTGPVDVAVTDTSELNCEIGYVADSGGAPTNLTLTRVSAVGNVTGVEVGFGPSFGSPNPSSRQTRWASGGTWEPCSASATTPSTETSATTGS